jgi:hypothetical protein
VAEKESAELSGYVISLQSLDKIIRTEVKKGNILIESGTIEGIDEKTFLI